MKKSIFKVLAVVALTAFSSPFLQAQNLTILSGLQGGAYNQLANDIKSVSTQPVDVLTSGGSIENVQKLLEKDGKINCSFVQFDVLKDEQKKNPNIKEILKIFQPMLFLEEIHIFTRVDAGITTMAQLAGKKVAIGSLTQGTRFTALNIKKGTGIAWEDIDMNSNDAYDALMAGKIDAFFYCGASPIPKFTKLTPEEQAKLQLVPLKHKGIPYVYIKQKLAAGTYSFVKEDMDIYSVPTLFMVRIYPGEINDKVEKLYKDTDEGMRKLMASGHHKAWEVAYENFRKALLEWPLYESDPGM